MKKRLLRISLPVIALIFFLNLQASFASASFTLHNESVQRGYSGGDQIRGSISLSLRQEAISSFLTSNFPGNTELLGFLKANKLMQGRDYNCTTKDCSQAYTVQNSISSINL